MQGSSTHSQNALPEGHYPLPEEWRSIFNDQGDGKIGISFEEAVQLVLYHPTLGYYHQKRLRVGKIEGSDFYTATTLGPIWAKLVLEGACTVIGKENASAYTFLEIGAEKDTDILSLFSKNNLTQTTPFLAHKTLYLGETWPALNDPCCAFSNELLDAQPFRKFQFKDNIWQERGLFWDEQGLFEGFLKTSIPESEACINRLPKDALEGYTIDFPTGAEALLKNIANNTAIKALVFFDYGKPWETLLDSHPEGTARAYYKHTQLNTLWSNLGQQDITHHIGWEPLVSILKEAGFQSVNVLRQETFFVKYATQIIKETFSMQANALNPEHRALQALLHPAHFGNKFQALVATR